MTPAMAPGRASTDAELFAIAQLMIVPQLNDPASAQWRDHWIGHGANTRAVCGYVSAKNAMGGYGPPLRYVFVAGGGAGYYLDQDKPRSRVDSAWRRHCLQRTP